jgi:uncharacterized protein
MTLQLRRDLMVAPLVTLLSGALVGTPVGVWGLATLPASWLRRLIGFILMGVVLIEWRDLYPRTVSGRYWGVAAGVVSGLLGGAIGTPGPPVILYAAAQGWPPRAMKATLQGFFFANQLVILVSQWWVGLLTPEVAWLALGFAPPAVVGVALGMHLFTAVDHARLRHLVFALLFVLGLTLWVVYLSPADKSAGPLWSRPRDVNQMGMSSHVGFPRPRAGRWPSTPAPLACSPSSPSRFSCSRVAYTAGGCGHGGTRHRSTSRSVQTWSVSPAAMAGVWGCQRVAEPGPGVGTGCSSGWRTRAWGTQKFSYT